MRITVFGSTGPTGRLVVEQALAAGHEVAAHARNPAKLEIEHERLRVVSGELTDDAAIARAVGGTGAVISVLGPGKKHTGTPISEGTQRIVETMQGAGVSRLVAVATPSAPDDADRFDPRFGPMIALVRVLVRTAYADIRATAEVVRGSGLQWTLLRLPLLRDGVLCPVRTGHLGMGDGKVGLKLTRASLAEYLLRCAVDGLHVHEAPMISDV